MQTSPRPRRTFLKTLAGVPVSHAFAPFAGGSPTSRLEAASGPEAFWFQVQQSFSVDRSLVNLNNGGVSPMPDCVKAALLQHVELTNQRPFYARQSWLRAQRENVRRELARMLDCSPDEIALTRNASEGMEICQLGLPLAAGDEIVTTNHDYPRMLQTWEQRASRDGIVVRRVSVPVPLSNPGVLLQRLEDAFTPRTRLLMMCHMVDLTGQILPVTEAVRMAHARDVPVLVDGAQTFGQIEFRIAELGCDFFATSLHKWLMGPPGTGLLYVRSDRIRDVWPLMPAGAGLEDDIRKFEDVGTESEARVLALAAATEFHQGLGSTRKEARLRELCDYWLEPLLESGRIRPQTARADRRSCALATIDVEGIESRALRDFLWEKHRIRVRPIAGRSVHGVRVSASVYNSFSELDQFVDVMNSVIKRGLV